MTPAELVIALRAVADGGVCRNGAGRYLYPPRTTTSDVLAELYREGLTYVARDGRGSVHLTDRGQDRLDAAPPPDESEPEDGEPYAPTPFLESNALLAVQIGDSRSAWTHLEALLDNELASLAKAAERIADMAWTLRNSRTP